MDIASIFGALGNAATGGVLGAIGGIAQAGLNLIQYRQQAAHELEMKKLDNVHESERWDHDLKLATYEADSKLKLAEVSAATEQFAADSAALAASFANDKRAYATDSAAERYPLLFAMVDFVRGMTRPAITVYLNALFAILATWITYELMTRFPTFWGDGKSLTSIFESLIDALIFMSTTATMWWFAARGMSKRGD